jgi:adenylate cyclase
MSADERRKLAAIMFTDMVGYSALSQRDEKLAQELLEEHRRLLREILPRFNGTEIKTIGDAFLVEFGSALEAAQCAIEIQRTLAKRNADIAPDRRIELKIGIHIGDVVHRGGDVYGDGVNIASRIEPVAGPGGICVSMDVERQIRNALEARFEKLAPTDLKNISVPMDLFRIVLPWERPSPTAAKSEIRNRQSGSDKSETEKRSWRILATSIAIILVLAGLLGYHLWRTRDQPAPRQNASPAQTEAATIPEKSIAVLPFDNLSRDPDNAYFAEGIQDEILTRLAKVADLKVIARTSSRKFQSAPENLPHIARQLGVRNILEGSVQKANDQVRVNVQLINALTEVHLWADIYDRKLTDLFTVESDIARAVVATLQAKLTGAEQSAIAARPTDNSDAHDLYLRGRYFEAKRRGGDLKHAIDYFNQAITKDPNYAPAYAGLAESYLLLPDYSDETPANTFPKARAAGEKALALDDKLPEAHVAMGLIWQSGYFDFERAGRELRRAAELNPNYAEAHYFLAILVLHALGQFDQAEAEMKRALVLDPFSLIINTNLGYTYTLARRYPEAIAQLNKALEMDPNFGYAYILRGTALELDGDVSGAIKEFERVQEIEKVEGGVKGLAKLAHAYALQGDRPKALQFLQEMKDLNGQKKAVWAYGYAIAYLALGDKSQAIDWLRRSYETKESGVIGNIGVDPLLDGLRDDPRFDALVREVIGPKQLTKK